MDFHAEIFDKDFPKIKTKRDGTSLTNVSILKKSGSYIRKVIFLALYFINININNLISSYIKNIISQIIGKIDV